MTKFLVVDDSQEDGYLLKTLLETNGYIVRVAVNGEVALKDARAHPPDIIISDVLMPVMDGFKFCLACKADEFLKNLPFVFYTASYTGAEDEMFAFDLGADRFVQKPQEPDRLIEILREVDFERSNPPQNVVQHSPNEGDLRDRYSAILVRKLEEKIFELELTRSELEIELRDRKKAQGRLCLLSDAIENSLNGFDIVDSEGKIIYANRSYLNMWGYNSLGEIYGTSPVSHSVDPEFHCKMIEELKKSGEAVMEFSARRKDGSEFEVIMYGRLSQDEHGREIYLGTSVDITDRKRIESELQEALSEIGEFRDQVEAENVYLREQIGMAQLHGNMVGESEAMKTVHLQISQVAQTDSSVLILGETGTGKELVASEIHNMSRRKDRSLIIVNCAAIPENLIESELFGREKGAYTGATTAQIGRFELADGGTIFLDEIGELPEAMQAKLLRVLQEGQIERLGSVKTIKIDVRLVAATNRDLANEILEGNFRQDLFYRLNVFPIKVPPLRDRREDIPAIVLHFVKEFADKMSKSIDSISKKSWDVFDNYPWPGNIRELRNVVERAMIRAHGNVLDIEHPGVGLQAGATASRKLAVVEQKHIASVLESCGWKIRGKNCAAEILGMLPTTLESRMKKLGIQRPK